MKSACRNNGGRVREKGGALGFAACAFAPHGAARPTRGARASARRSAAAYLPLRQPRRNYAIFSP
jgi:hypothetical protein